MSRALLRRRVRGVLAAYAAARFVPRYGLPSGVTYNPATGLCEGQPFSTSYLVVANEVTLTHPGTVGAAQTLLQDAITAAGTTATRIRLTAGNWGTGYTIPAAARAGAGLVIEDVRVGDGTFPVAEGGRVGRATSLPVVFSLAGNEVTPCFQLGSGTGRVRFVGLDFRHDPTYAATLANVGAAGAIGTTVGYVACFFGTEASTDVVIDRCRALGPTGKRSRRGFWLHGQRIGYVGNYIADFYDHTQDTQCILVTRNTDGMVVDNNYLACAYGQPLFFGGGDSAQTLAQSTKNVTVRRNTLDYPATYRTNGWPPKAMLETKGSESVLVEGNAFSNHFAGTAFEFGNQFHPVVIKSAHWRVQNWTLRANRFANCAAWLNVQTEGDNNTAGASAGVSRLDVLHNAMLAPTGDVTGGYQWPTLLTDIANADLPAEFLQEWSLRENTIRHGFTGGANAAWMFDAIQSEAIGWNIENNIVAAEASGTPDTYYNRPGGTAFTAATNYAAKTKSGSVWGGNVVVASGGAVIPGDIAVANVAALNLDASLRPTSGAAVGKGADIDLITAAIGSGGGAA
jgi:hypothetical protein